MKKEKTPKTNDSILSLKIIERNLYGLFIIISICLLPITIYTKIQSKILCPILLIIELIIFIFSKKYINKTSINNLIKKEKKLNTIKIISNIVFAIAAISLLGIIIFMIKDLIISNSLKYIYQIFSLNIISLAIFILLIVVIFNFTKESKENNNTDISQSKNENTIDSIYAFIENKKENNKLVKVIYLLFILLTCFVPFMYIYINATTYLMSTVWIIGTITTLIFGILLSVILKIIHYNKTSYNILALTVMIVSFIGIFSNLQIIFNFITTYMSLLLSILISILILYRYDKKTKLYTILLILIILGLITALIFA